MLHRLGPYLAKKIDPPQYFYRCPEYNYRSNGETDICAPRTNFKLFFQHESRTNKATNPYYEGYRMMIAQKIIVITEHKQQIAGPKQHV